MPIQQCQEDGRPGWQCGDAGKCYTYDAGDDAASLRAKKKAIAQCIAMGEDPSSGKTGPMRETKALHVEVKDAEQGQVEAVFATLNVKDHDGDVTVPGAFKDGQEVRISAYNHGSWNSALPVGKGVIREDGDKAVLDGQFFLNTQPGKDTFTVVKELGPLMEWSYGFDVLESSTGEFDGEDVRYLKNLDVFEVSPVLLGAGIGTGTLSAKHKDSFPDQFESVLGDVHALVDRAKAWGLSEEAKAGRVVSSANYERLTTLAESLVAAHAELSAFLAEHDPEKQRREVEREFLLFHQAIANNP